MALTIVFLILKKANIYNQFFASKCVPLNNDSNILYYQRYMTNANTSSINFKNKDNINVTKTRYPCKAHGYDDISIGMLKMYDSTIVEPLTILFKS